MPTETSFTGLAGARVEMCNQYYLQNQRLAPLSQTTRLHGPWPTLGAFAYVTFLYQQRAAYRGRLHLYTKRFLQFTNLSHKQLLLFLMSSAIYSVKDSLPNATRSPLVTPQRSTCPCIYNGKRT